MILLLYFWFKLGEITKEEFDDFCNKFNSEFMKREDIEYEIQILNGADELRDFLIERYSKCENFDKDKLCSICSNELFAGKPLKDFLDILFV